MILVDGYLKRRGPGWIYRHYIDSDGWRGWMVKDGKYYFSDVPDKNIVQTQDALDKMLNKTTTGGK